MRIAQVAPLCESVPPRLYGGTERVVHYLTEELVGMGHDVTLFASGDSETSARLVAGCPRALWREEDVRETLPHHVRLVEMVAREAHRFDVIHFHLDYVHFPVVGSLPCPTLTTHHGQLRPADHMAFLRAFPDVPLASISDSQRRLLPDAAWRATVHHGLPPNIHTFRPQPGAYLAFLGRISPEKGLDDAIDIAHRSGLPLRIAAKVYPEERPYYEAKIRPLLESCSWVELIGEVGGEAKDFFLGEALALVFPIRWEEPFGLVMIEAMACGTPVVAYRRGSTPEVVRDGVTGFLADDIEGAAAAVGKIPLLDRSACRSHVERLFHSSRMAHSYVEVYRELIRDGIRHGRHRSRDVAGPSAGFPVH